MTQPTVNPGLTLRIAARYIEVHGWTQGDYYDYSGRRKHPRACLIGAIGCAAHGRPTDNPHSSDLPNAAQFAAAHAVLEDYLCLGEDYFHDVPDATIGDWNDRPDMTPAQVIRALNKAADRWGQQLIEALSDDDWDRTYGGAA